MAVLIYAAGTGSNGLALVADMRTSSDREKGPEACLDTWFAKSVLGNREWARTRRIALWDYLEDTKKLTPENQVKVAALPEKKRGSATKRYLSEQKREKLALMRQDLRKHGIRCVIVLQTLSRQQEAHSITGTCVWDELGWHGTLYDSQGTINRDSDGFDVLPILNPGNFDWAYTWLIKKWIRWGWHVAQGKLAPIKWPESSITPDEHMVALLERIRQAPEVSVDIEAYTPAKVITAIGLGTGDASVSVPWDSYNVPAGYVEPGYDSYPLGQKCADMVREILSDARIAKVFHNGAFDVPELEGRGIPVRGPVEDTLLAHRVAYPQYAHKLQLACATEFLVEPWKSLHHSDKYSKDEPDFWIERPEQTRWYNTKDNYSQWLLWQSLRGRVGL